MNSIEHLNNYSESLEKYVTSKPIDSTIAQNISNFINGYVDTLPRFNDLNTVIGSIDTKMISEGYGVRVFFVENKENECYEIVVSISTKVDIRKERYDKITSNNHESKYIIGRLSLNAKDHDENDVRFKDFPTIEGKRIRYLQYFLREFGNIGFEKEEPKEKSKRKKIDL